MPHSFPPKDLGAPTPGTTSLNEPPKGALPAPPAIDRISNDMPNGYFGADANIPLPLVMEEYLKHLTGMERRAFHQATVFFCSLAIVLRQATIIKDSFLADANLRGRSFIRPAVIHTTLVERIESLEERYRRAQVNCRRRYAMSTLDTHLGQLEIEVHVSKTAVSDTGAGTIIMVKMFASKLLKCSNVLLEPSQPLVTASGI